MGCIHICEDIYIYIINRESRKTVFERTVEDRLSEGNELFQAEGPQVNHGLLIHRLTYARIEWSWWAINEDER